MTEEATGGDARLDPYREVSDEDLRAAVEKHQPVTTEAVADAVDAPVDATRRGLERLDEDGRGVVGGLVGNSFVWIVREG